ncbi:MAG TPA: hypothetical protein PLP29_08920 [Candidatus Ozemobacteraceae bacterium]|nr:hypothetical protein [Candidatus Ozemobacteraceae bacterium]
MRNVFALLLMVCTCILIGCLGSGGSGSSWSGGTGDIDTQALISGWVSIDRNGSKMYGGIPIIARNRITWAEAAKVTTNSSGYFSFSKLAAGIYDIVMAIPGDREIIFAHDVKTDGVSPGQVLPARSLIGIQNLLIDRIGSDSFHLSFDSNTTCVAVVEYQPVGGDAKTVTLTPDGAKEHEGTLTGLLYSTKYDVTIKLTDGDTGQEFVMPGLLVSTTGTVGPRNLSVVINAGSVETNFPIVTLSLHADGCSEMLISESPDFSDASWVNYAETYTHTFKDTSAGRKWIFVKFRDADSNESTVQMDAILLAQVGYQGISINDGSALTNSAEVVLEPVYPGATFMQLADNPAFSYSYWESYTETKRWRFSSVDGLKTIYCRFKGGQANAEEVFTASILLDTTPPLVTLKINDGATVTATTSVTLTMSYTTPPLKMQLSNTTAPASSSTWLPFGGMVAWTLPSGDGAKEVFGVFKDGAGNQYGPISSKITLDTVAPLNDAIFVRITENTTSDVATYALIASLPVYLHFDVKDDSTTSAYYAVANGTSDKPSPDRFVKVRAPFSPVQFTEATFKSDRNTAVGTYTIWVYFTDDAGNPSFDKTAKMKIDGPRLVLSPASVTLTSGKNIQFTAVFENIEARSVTWSLAPPLVGTIDQQGLYEATAPIRLPSVATVTARTQDGLLTGEATVNLATSVEILFKDGTDETYGPLEYQLSPGSSKEVQIRVLNDHQGVELLTPPSAGSRVLSSPSVSGADSLVTLTYTAPSSAPAPSGNPVVIGICAKANPEVVGSLSFLIAEGAGITLSPKSGEAQRNSPLPITATVVGTTETAMVWKISPTSLGSFDPGSVVTTTTTTDPNHRVTFYAASPEKIGQAEITASIDGASERCPVTVYPPIQFVIAPPATTAMPLITPITFKAQGFDYLLGNATEAVTWQFKNAGTSKTDFKPADGKTYSDRGSLTVIDATTAEYRRPAALPSLSDPTASDSVLIRAVSKADSAASATAIATLTPKVAVKLYTDVERTATAIVAATVAEVGKLQFFATVTPPDIGDTSVAWTVNDTAGNAQIGTIDANGLYIAPDIISINQVTIKAASKYDPTSFATVTVNLSDFWLPKRDNMFDSVTGEPMQITSLLVDPTTPVGDDFIVYAGTRGYGVWVATFSDTAGDVTGGFWQPFGALGSRSKKSDGQYAVSHLAVSSNREFYAATASGIWHLAYDGTLNGSEDSFIVQKLDNLLTVDANFLKLAFNSHDPSELFASTPNGVYKIQISNDSQVDSKTKILNVFDPYKTIETRLYQKVTPTDPPVTTTHATSAYSFDDSSNPIGSILNTLVYDDYNDRLYAAGDSGIFLRMNDTVTGNLRELSSYTFLAPEPDISMGTGTFFELGAPLDIYYITTDFSGTALDMAIDAVNRNTIWAATVSGVYRSISNGMPGSWEKKPFAAGSSVNTRAIIVDSTNTINVLAGSEDGLYRSTDAGATWKRIKSGLGNHKTITSLIQAAGIAGARRKVWAGTAGGVFMGRQSLDLE